ncbi:MAG: tripartite tricarboxylate transporter substrate binding protein [Rhodospirillales bacterium]|nr:tripartite tricarboxylate transporter substrate binding protein [Rhodospirillales bacterium]
MVSDVSKHVSRTTVVIIALVLSIVAAPSRDAAAWEPRNPVEFVVPAGTGGGSDVLARFLVSIIDKHKLSPKPLVVVNKPGGGGAEALLYTKEKKEDPHTIMITPNLLFVTPLHTGIPFSWKDLTPISLLAEDLFILWVNAESPYMTAKQYLDAVKAKPLGFKMGGTAQEDQVVTHLLESAVGGLQFNYVPFKGGGEVCVNLVGKHVDSTVNNPSECVSHWKAGKVRPLAVLDRERATWVEGQWKDIPTTKEALGADIQYLMLRAIFGAPGMKKDVVEFYTGLMKKVHATPEFQKYLADNALKGSFVTGAEFVSKLDAADKQHVEVMTKHGMVKKK